VARYLENGEGHLTPLVPDLKGIDPDDSFSSVPYERGMNLLLHLQQGVGKQAFQAFFRKYVEDFAAKPITSHVFREYFTQHFENSHPDVTSKVDWEGWFLKEGMPPVEPKYDLSLMDPVKELAKDFAEGSPAVLAAPPRHDFSAWPSLQQQLFLQEFLNAGDVTGTAVPKASLVRLDELYGLSSKQNSELLFKWCRLNLKAGRPGILKPAADFLVSQGRMKFVRPLFRELLEAPIPGAKELAVGTFAANKDAYHPICRKMVASDMEKGLKKFNDNNDKTPPRPSQPNSPSGSSSSSSSSSSSAAAPTTMTAFMAGMSFGIGFGAVAALIISKNNKH